MRSLTSAGTQNTAKQVLGKQRAELGRDKYGDKTPMLGVLFGQGEVLLIVIMTAVVVYLVARRRKRKC